MEDTLRAFIALPLPPEVIELVSDLQSRLRSQGLKLRWARPQGMHLTLKFLGDVPASFVADLDQAMQCAVSGCGMLNLAVQGMGVFPGIKRPRVLWLGIGGELERLGELHRRLDAELERIGVARERRPFRAHLTVARVKGAVDARQLLEAVQAHGHYEPRSFAVRQMVLYQSDLKPQGAVYTAKAKVEL
jgi:2'-5' RNA ligase